MPEIAFEDYQDAMIRAMRRIDVPRNDLEYSLAAAALVTFTYLNKNDDPLGSARSHLEKCRASDSWHKKLNNFALSFFREIRREDLIERYRLSTH